MIHSSIEQGSFFNDANQAIIAVLPKPNKDPTLCSSYRPLSILNTEIKVYARALATRVETYMTKLIHNDQTGFIKSRLASDNVRRLLHIIHATRDSESPCAVLSLDAEKAFDRLEWDYLWMVLEKFGFDLDFIKLTKLLYSNPSAVIVTGHNMSSQFPVSRSCRQGCPFSPLLFALSLEPLAQSIRQHPLISPIIYNDTKHYIALYADDVLLFTDNTPSSIPYILDTFSNFSLMSGYKINWSKSSLLPLNSKLNRSLLPPDIPIAKHFKYLGIDVYPSLPITSFKNFLGIRDRIEWDLER